MRIMPSPKSLGRSGSPAQQVFFAAFHLGFRMPGPVHRRHGVYSLGIITAPAPSFRHKSPTDRPALPSFREPAVRRRRRRRPAAQRSGPRAEQAAGGFQRGYAIRYRAGISSRLKRRCPLHCCSRPTPHNQLLADDEVTAQRVIAGWATWEQPGLAARGAVPGWPGRRCRRRSRCGGVVEEALRIHSMTAETLRVTEHMEFNACTGAFIRGQVYRACGVPFEIAFAQRNRREGSGSPPGNGNLARVAIGVGMISGRGSDEGCRFGVAAPRQGRTPRRTSRSRAWRSSSVIPIQPPSISTESHIARTPTGSDAGPLSIVLLRPERRRRRSGQWAGSRSRRIGEPRPSVRDGRSVPGTCLPRVAPGEQCRGGALRTVRSPGLSSADSWRIGDPRGWRDCPSVRPLHRAGRHHQPAGNANQSIMRRADEIVHTTCSGVRLRLALSIHPTIAEVPQDGCSRRMRVQGERLDMLCGRFFIGPPHDRLIRDYLPTTLVVRAMAGRDEAGNGARFGPSGESHGADADGVRQ